MACRSRCNNGPVAGEETDDSCGSSKDQADRELVAHVSTSERTRLSPSSDYIPDFAGSSGGGTSLFSRLLRMSLKASRS